MEQTTPPGDFGALPVQWHMRLYPATPLLALHDALVEDGLEPTPMLIATGLDLAEARSPATRVSRQQILDAFSAVIDMGVPALFAFRTGLRTRLTYFGMYGFALMSAPDMRSMLQFAVEQQGLDASLTRIWARQRPGEVEIGMDPFSHVQIDARLYRFLVESNFGIIQRGWRDLTGVDFTPRRLCVTYPECTSTREIAVLLGVEVLFAQPANAFVFDAAWLDSRPQFGNLIAHESVREACTSLSARLKEQSGLAGKVGESLVTNYGRVRGIECMAATLGMSDRGMRRMLRAEGTSYGRIHDDVRAQVAMKYLRDTTQPVESVAATVGFNDAANFRRAFRRWTGKSPVEYRAATAHLPD
ncbi:AraC family transcriptional regulator ligand-binding domain-containing protein [Rhodanobacter lindaniclasticus]